MFSEAFFRVFTSRQFVVKGYHCKPVDIRLRIFHIRNRHFLTDYRHQRFPKFSDSMKIVSLSFRTQKKTNYFFPSEYLGELRYTRTYAHTGTVIVTTISCSPQVGSTTKKQKNNTTMKFHEILTKAESDISKIWNFTRKPLFPWQSVVKKLNQVLIRIGILQESPFFHERVSNWKTYR